MKNTLELQLRAVRSPRVLKKTDAGIPEFIDIWASHHSDCSPRQWSIAVKFGREMVESAMKLAEGTLFTVKGRLDQSQDPKTKHYHTFIWADEISDVVPSRKGRSGPPPPDLPNFPNAETTQEEAQP
jgi:hypothetical protein